MAKRAQPDEVPYRPLLNTDLISAAVAPEPVKLPVATAPAQPLSVVENPIRTLQAPTPALAQSVAITPPVRIEEIKRVQPTVSQAPTTAKPENAISAPFDHQKRILFTEAESLALERVSYDLSLRLKTQVKVSHVVRAMLRPFLTSEAYISAVASFAPPISRPGNANLHELQQFEHAIGLLMEMALMKRLESKAA